LQQNFNIKGLELNKLRYFSPVRFCYGLIIIGSALIKTLLAKAVYPKSRKYIESLSKNGFLFEPDKEKSKNLENINTINKSFENTNQLKSVVNGAFVAWTKKSSTHYLIPDTKSKRALVDIFQNSDILPRLSAHHGFQFYCKSANVFKTEASEASGTTSTYFHRDGHPPYTYKLMIYLTQVEEDSGAFSYVPGSVNKLIVPTFGSYSYARPFAAKNYGKHSLCGDVGTKILFNNNGLHAGGRTKKGERIVVTYILHPRFLHKHDNSIINIDWSVGGREYSII